MRRLAASWPWLALFGAALVVGVATSAASADDFPIPSVANAGPKGARVLLTWLSESGGQAESLAAPLTVIPAGVQVLVIAAPTARVVSGEEVKSIATFVDQGGTLIYLAPRPVRAQPELEKWLKLDDVRVPVPAAGPVGDVGGMTIDVDPLQASLLPGVKQLRVSADTQLDVGAPDAVQVAGKALWVRPLGKGQVWIAAGADVIENRRLDLNDNLQLWANLRSMRIAFDEFHHSSEAAPRWSANLWASLLQFIFVALLFVAARAPRLGPARPTLESAHRSSLEYVSSMGALMRRAGVEGELKLKLRERLRRLMQERLGIAIALSADEASRLLAGLTGIAPDAYLQLDKRLTNRADDFVAAAAEAARIEDLVVGRQG